MGEFSISHLLLITLIFLVFFGPKKLPELGSSIGKAIKNFKQSMNEIDLEAKDVKDPVKTEQIPEARPTQTAARTQEPVRNSQNDAQL